MPHGLRSFGLLLLGACTPLGAGSPGVRPGIEVLLTDSAHLVAGRRVGILTNQTGVDRVGTGDVERLLAAGVRVTAIFSPEHGFRGVLDRENIGHSVDSATGLPIFSLYGESREPTPEMLRTIDVLLIDLQDIGARTYSYPVTALRSLRAAAAGGIPVVLLDRPNPVGGVLLQGPMLDTAFASFAGAFPVPLRHGMTIGELVRFGNAVLGVRGALTVVPAAGWRRGQWFDQTALPWVKPSLNMPDLESASHYPGVVLLEASNLSVGRGTPIAFQVVGAPWLDAPAVAAALRGAPGVAVTDTTVTPVEPSDGKHAGRALRAIRLRVTDREAYDPTALATRLLEALYRLHRDSLVIAAARFDRLAGSDRLRRALEAGGTADSIVRSWRPGLARFERERAAYLIYPR